MHEQLILITGTVIFFILISNPAKQNALHKQSIENNPRFSFHETRIVYSRNQNLYAWNIQTGETEQLTNIKITAAPERAGKTGSQQEEWLKNDQLRYFEVLRSRKEKRDAAEKYN